MCAALRKHTGALRGFSLKGGPNLWLKDIDPKLREKENAQKDTRPSAKLSYARVSVQKACFVLDAIRGKDVQTALGILEYNPRYASSLIKKLLESAIANAENNNGMNTRTFMLQSALQTKDLP